MWLVVCALFTLERGVCVSSYLRDMEDTETIEFMLRLVSRMFLTAWAVHTGNEPGTMKFLRMEVEVLWFQLFCKTRTEKIRWSGCVNCESDPWMIEAFLKEAMLGHLVTYATPCALDWYPLPSLSGIEGRCNWLQADDSFIYVADESQQGGKHNCGGF